MRLIDQSKYTTSSPYAGILKVPLLRMTTTFKIHLLGILEKMIGIKVLRENYLWSGRWEVEDGTLKY